MLATLRISVLLKSGSVCALYLLHVIILTSRFCNLTTFTSCQLSGTFPSDRDKLNNFVKDGEMSFAYSFKILPDISSGPLALVTSIFSSINLVSAIVIWFDPREGLINSLISGIFDACWGISEKLLSKNLLKRNALRTGVLAHEFS